MRTPFFLLFVYFLLPCCFVAVCADSWADPPAPPARRVEVHLYGRDMREGAPLASWYRTIGITDVWLYPLKGAFPQDHRPGTAKEAGDLEASGTLDAYRRNHLRYWWFEHPVPDILYQKGKRSGSSKSCLWDDSPEADALWDGVCRRIASIYPTARQAGFAGLVYDNEAYHSYQGDESGKIKPYLWKGHEEQIGVEGNYYKRGRQVGRAINAVWPKAKVIMVYAFGHESERWWYQGVTDGGTQLYLGNEHTYGAGPPGDLGSTWYHSWWGGKKTKEVSDWKRSRFPFLSNNQRVMAGLFPIEFGKKRPNYRAKYFREQLASAANDDPNGPIPVWIWPQGPFSPQSWEAVKYAPGDTASDYLQALREFSQAFADPSEK